MILNIIEKKLHRKISDETLVTFLNPYSYLLARKHIHLFDKFDLIYIDGIALVKFLGLFGFSGVERKSFDMTSLAPIVFEDAVTTLKTVYLIGAMPNLIDKSVENLKSIYPGLSIVGCRHGFFDDPGEREKTVNEIVGINPDIIICGMGVPLQEQFLVDLKGHGWKGVGYTCGGFIHQMAKRVDYYPVWSNKYNLRWLYRIYDEPKLLKRYMWEYPKFVIYFMYDIYMRR